MSKSQKPIDLKKDDRTIDFVEKIVLRCLKENVDVDIATAFLNFRLQNFDPNWDACHEVHYPGTIKLSENLNSKFLDRHKKKRHNSSKARAKLDEDLTKAGCRLQFQSSNLKSGGCTGRIFCVCGDCVKTFHFKQLKDLPGLPEKQKTSKRAIKDPFEDVTFDEVSEYEKNIDMLKKRIGDERVKNNLEQQHNLILNSQKKQWCKPQCQQVKSIYEKAKCEVCLS